MTAAENIEVTFDKGLRGTLPEQLATVSTLSRLVQDNPVPTYINSLILRLSKAFRDGSLDLRVAIARALGQCRTHIKLAFSSAEIFRRVLTVSHSNDPNAREATLDVLAELASLNPDCKTTLHLIRESLSTKHNGEFRAACHALQEFTAISQSFTESIVLQIGKILEEDEVSEPRKMLLCSTFSTMSATAQVVEQVFGIAELILRRSISDTFFHAFLKSTTSLCMEIRYSIPKQIDLLLGLLNPTNGYPPSDVRRIIILKELKRLANYTSIWSEQQVNSFTDFLEPKMSPHTLVEFFEATTSLVKNTSHENLKLLKNIAVSSTGYGSHANTEVSIRFIHFVTQVFCSPRTFEGDPKEYIDSTMTAFTVIVVNACTSGKLKKRLASRLYRAVGDLLLVFPYTQNSFSPMIISAVFTAFDSAITDDCNQRERLDLLCRLADSDKLYIRDIHRWACTASTKNKNLFHAYPSRFSYLCLAVGTVLPDECSPILYEGFSASIYETAQNALRNGQWQEVASPNLERINLFTLPQIQRSWISALRELAKSQINEMNLDELERQQSHLLSALSILKSGQFSEKHGKEAKQWMFPIGMISAMLTSSHAHFHLLSVILPFQTVLSGALKPDKFFNPVVAKRFLTALSACESSLNDAVSEWTALVRASFCADPTSFDLITLYYLRVSILHTAVKVALRKQSPDIIIQIPQLSSNRTCSLFQRERLQWVIDKIRQLRYDFHPNINIINNLHKMIEQLAVIPYMLPRFFFHQFYHVNFKVTTTPQAEKDKPLSVMNGETIPIRVDGSLTSNHSTPLRSVIVFAEIISNANHSYQPHKESVDIDSNNHFTAQFLLSFKQSCEVKIRVEFTDQTTRKQWNGEGGTTLPIAVREKYNPSVYDYKRGGVQIPADPRQMIRNPMFATDSI